MIGASTSMNRTALGLAALATTATLAAASPALAKTAPDHDGDRRPCVTWREFGRIDQGDTKTWTREVFDTRGHHALPFEADEMYDDIAVYGVRLDRLPMRYRDVRTYDVCLDHGVTDGVARVLYDTRGHRVVIADMETTGTTGRQFAGMIEPPVDPTPEMPESPLCDRCG